MPWHVFLKLASRKNRAQRAGRASAAATLDAAHVVAIGAVILLLLSAPATLSAQEIVLHSVSSGAAGLSVRIDGAPTERIVDALGDGMRARVELVLRVLEEVDGLAGLLGDRVVRERRISQEAFYDPFSERYVVEVRRDAADAADPADAAEDPKSVRFASDMAEAIDELMTFRGVEVPSVPHDAASDAYVLAQARLTPLALAENLRLVALAIPEYVLQSSWVRVSPSEHGPEEQERERGEQEPEEQEREAVREVEK